jgi:cobyrinic acid a,c-diamide synthase
VVAAPASGSGKTTLTAGLLRAFRRRGLRAAALKVGPDFIDPVFHSIACGHSCRNIDGWAMRPETRLAQVRTVADQADIVVIEGVMGLFDGSASGEGSTADIASSLGLPVMLVVDVHAQSASAAAVALGFARYRDDVEIAGVVLNRLAGERHRSMIEPAFARTGLQVLGGVLRNPALELPSRHLGLVQAAEHPQLEKFLDAAADALERSIDLDEVIRRARPIDLPTASADFVLKPLGRHIAVARDSAFSFCYPHIVESWREQGTEISWFSPLADESPNGAADSAYLPGGYPELFAAQLAAGSRWKSGLRDVATGGGLVYGECGGFMALGTALVDADGTSHPMANLLPHVSSFAAPRLSMAYRTVSFLKPLPFARMGETFRAHEFHYATSTQTDACEALLSTGDAETSGLRRGTVCGSFVHLIDRYHRGYDE